MHRWLVLSLALFLGCGATRATPSRAPRVTAAAGDAAWSALAAALPGTWQAEAGSHMVAVELEPIAGESAILERFGPPGRHTAMAYHRDGPDVVVTHYCAQGNQPRLRLVPGDAASPRFVMVDATDLDPDEAVLAELAFDLRGRDELTRVEVYRQPDGTLERTSWTFHRAPPAPPSR